jgi:homoserine kinase
MSSCVKVRIPGTTANCGPGFDAIGIACTIYNEMSLTLTKERELVISVQGEGRGIIPLNDKNIACRAIYEVLNRVDHSYSGMRIVMNNLIPLARGLGSSAAAIVGGLVAANGATGNQLSDQVIFELATRLEGHPDNVAPAIFGGVTVSVIREAKPLAIRFMPPKTLNLVVAIPEFGLSTRSARQVLPKTVSFQDACFNVGSAALLIGALSQGNFDVIRYALEDRLHQAYREKLIPGMPDVFSAAVEAGALGAALSGAGPCLIAFTEQNQNEVGEAMVKAFSHHGVKSSYRRLNIDTDGAKIVAFP